MFICYWELHGKIKHMDTYFIEYEEKKINYNNQ